MLHLYVWEFSVLIQYFSNFTMCVCLRLQWSFQLWLKLSVRVCLWDTNDVSLWVCSGFYLKYTVWGQTHRTHTNTRPEWVLTKVLTKGSSDPESGMWWFCLCSYCVCLCLWMSGLCAYMWYTWIIRGNVSLHDIMGCNDRKLVALWWDSDLFYSHGKDRVTLK